jgi:homocysteine S-methyltransferase
VASSFLDAIRERVIVCDGAVGTMLYAKGVFINRCFDGLNLTEPKLVIDVHQEYLRAGSDVIETNTFGANRMKLSAFGLADKVRDINREGARLAKQAARDQAWIAGAIGPLGVRIEPWGKTGVDEARELFREQAEALVEGGVDLLILETFRDLNEVGAAIDAVRGLCDLPIVAQMTTEEDGNSLDGTPPERFGPELERKGAAVIGVNCSVGPAPMLETIERLERVTRLPLSAQPNAGKPRDIEGRNIYLCSPEYMASYARRFIDHGVRLVGGCCGTTPEHIRQIRGAVRSSRVSAPAQGDTPRVSPVVDPGVQPVPRPEKSRMAHEMARGRMVVGVELLPPRGLQVEETIARARALKIRGVDVINVPDGPRATARMSALSMAVLVEQHVGIETMLHYACRDRNMLSMQSDLLGAHAMGLRNLLIVTGDPPRAGTYPDATAVFDVDSIGLTNIVARLNRGLDIGGKSIGEPTAFHIGVAANPSALNLDEEVRRFHYKVEAGAEFAVTQPIFDLADVEAFLKRIEGVRIPIIAGLWPFESARNAEFLANEVPGVRVPEELLARMRRAGDGDAAVAEGVSIARELACRLRGLVQGFQVSAPSGNIDAALGVIEAVGR